MDNTVFMEARSMEKMHEIFWVAEVNAPNMIKVVGVGLMGRLIVGTIHRDLGERFPCLDFAIVDTPHPMTPMRIWSAWGELDVEKVFVDGSAPDLEERMLDVVKDTQMLFVVFDPLDSYCLPMVSALFRQIRANCEDRIAVGLLLPPPDDDLEDKALWEKSRNAITSATKSIVIEKDEEKYDLPHRQVCDVIENVCGVFLNTQFHVDYNDVATILQTGGGVAVYGLGRGKGEERIRRAVSELVRDLESKGCLMGEVKGLLMVVHTSPLQGLSSEEWKILRGLLGKNTNVLINCATDITEAGGNSIEINAVAVF